MNRPTARFSTKTKTECCGRMDYLIRRFSLKTASCITCHRNGRRYERQNNPKYRREENKTRTMICRSLLFRWANGLIARRGASIAIDRDHCRDDLGVLPGDGVCRWRSE